MLQRSCRLLIWRNFALQKDLGEAIYEFRRGKKWKPSSDDIDDHENYGFYLKRWRRRKIRNILGKEDSTSRNGFDFPELKRASPYHESNMDMFYTDGFHEQEEYSDDRQESRNWSNTKPRNKKRITRRYKPPSSSSSNNGWTHNLRNFYDDELDYEELQQMYGCFSDDEDIDQSFGHFTGNAHPKQKAKSSKQTEQKPPVVSRECRVHLRVLGLPSDALITAKDLKEAFYKRALQWHPDRHEEAQKANAESKFKQVQEAYHALQAHIE